MSHIPHDYIQRRISTEIINVMQYCTVKLKTSIPHFDITAREVRL